MTTPLPAPTATSHRAAPDRSRRPALAVAVAALLGAAVATTVALTGPVAAPPDAAPAAAPTTTPAPAASATTTTPVADVVTVEARPLVDGCGRAGCTIHHLVTNHGRTAAEGVFVVTADGHDISVVPLDVPPGGTAEIATWIPGALVEAHPQRGLKIDGTFRPLARETT